MSPVFVIGISIAYLALLFLIAYLTEVRKSKTGKSLVNNPYVYALSLAVYCTAWTFYGSIGKASVSGIDFLPIYLGPTIAATVWWFVLRKMIRISKLERITSIADFISSRYGKSTALGFLVTVFCLFAIIPYISIQLKAIVISYDILTHDNILEWDNLNQGEVPFYLDTAWYITIALAIFVILFGTRRLDPNERHEGLVAAVAFESLFKLLAFLLAGIFVVYGLFDGFGDIFKNAAQYENLRKVMFLEGSALNGTDWFFLVLVSVFAILFLPRQFHISVVENTNPDFVKKASWVFPAYLFLINIFVLPIAIGGASLLGSEANPDMFILSIPLVEGRNFLAILIALGGFSAATSMIMVAITALSIMISNNFVLPMLLKSATIRNPDVSSRLLAIRRISVVVVLILSYGYFKSISVLYPIVSIGLISFAGVAQFAPAMLGAMYWKKGTKAGAIAGLSVGFLFWMLTLALPTLSEAGILSESFIVNGLFNIGILKPYSLFGLENWGAFSHGVFWSLLFNTLAFVIVSLKTQSDPIELIQADRFVNVNKYRKGGNEQDFIRRAAKKEDIIQLLSRFLGEKRATKVLKRYEKRHQKDLNKIAVVDEELINLAERHLTGAIGAASAKILLNSIVESEEVSMEKMFKILEQTQEIFQYSKELESKSRELSATTEQLKFANEQLKELDRLKADFITTITHELRTPITSIKALAQILFDNAELPKEQKQQYLDIIIKESGRIGRMVNQVLDLEKLQSVKEPWDLKSVDFGQIVKEVCINLSPLIEEKQINCQINLPDDPVLVAGLKDKLIQAVTNLISNAVKFCDVDNPQIKVQLESKQDYTELRIMDNGPGISDKDKTLVFEKFAQVTIRQFGKPEGTGLGLPITKEIVDRHQGTIRIEDNHPKGASFVIQLALHPGFENKD